MSAREVIALRVIRELCDDDTLTLDGVNVVTLVEGYRYADSTLADLRAAGWEVVPQRATEVMLWRGWDKRPKEETGNTLAAIGDVWTAMLTAAAQERETTDGS